MIKYKKRPIAKSFAVLHTHIQHTFHLFFLPLSYFHIPFHLDDGSSSSIILSLYLFLLFVFLIRNSFHKILWIFIVRLKVSFFFSPLIFFSFLVLLFLRSARFYFAYFSFFLLFFSLYFFFSFLFFSFFSLSRFMDEKVNRFFVSHRLTLGKILSSLGQNEKKKKKEKKARKKYFFFFISHLSKLPFFFI